MTKRIVLSPVEIYSRIVKRTDSASYYYYTEPFKEKVFFFPLAGFYDQWVKGNVREIILVPFLGNPERMTMMDFKTYTQNEKSTWDDFD